MNKSQKLPDMAKIEKEIKEIQERRKFLVSFIKEQLEAFNSLSSEDIDTIPTCLLESTSKDLSLLMLSVRK